MQIHDTAFIAPGAVVLGDVTIGENSGIWYNAVVRGDRDSIVIGRESNIQDNAVVHLGSGYPVEIGDHVTIGHGAIIHGCKIGDNTMIGMGAILMNGCKIGKNCIIGAGALVTQNVEIPDNSLVIGIRLYFVITKKSRENLHYVTIFSTISLFIIAVSLCTGRRLE